MTEEGCETILEDYQDLPCRDHSRKSPVMSRVRQNSRSR
ncbi:hypothetical protein R2601_04303 [Salipiger bermudensis HTCC2601]|uniref:Uncharacterized protein n=1 Tax=Salipiger bermudensis (strain DSM 26914 / JCM 13377 / KCTC 12554 / HTCC2601) TaxID=314265 RepID=Q0FVY5_SALBH|nr:hypothetical protein R2601_04303 [Salipiger bermudensis HTCC2601]